MISLLLQVAGVILLEEKQTLGLRRTLSGTPPIPPPSTILWHSVREQARKRGKEEDDVPNAASLLLPLHSTCDGHSTVLGSPRVTSCLSVDA